ncbi:MAG: hypothetical protein LBO09_04015 [Candidatus Peribacteria bacterium]|nr:hypothetical protein [Candidatus Peribacteria bacterium]
MFSDPSLKPDELKVYPTSVIPNTELFRLYQAGEYQPITTEQILQIIRTIFQDIIPPYTRIKRLIRDIPAPEISAGSSVTNLSQLAHDGLLREYKEALSSTSHRPSEERGEALAEPNDEETLYKNNSFEMQNKESLRSDYNDKDSSLPPHEFGSVQNDDSVGREEVLAFYKRLYENNELIQTEIIGSESDLASYRNFVSLDTRSREVRNKTEKTTELNLIIRQYQSSVGSEFFISYEDELGYLYGFTRLLLPLPEHTVDYP